MFLVKHNIIFSKVRENKKNICCLKKKRILTIYFKMTFSEGIWQPLGKAASESN